jgi:hypothetical protein
MQIRSVAVGPVVIALGWALSSALGQASPTVQWQVEFGGNGHWYQAIILPTAVSWETAASSAQVRGGYLATIVNEAEGVFVASQLSSWVGYPACQTYIGGYRVGDSWQWATGERGDYWPWNCGHCHDSCQPDSPCENFALIMCTAGGNVRLNNAGGCIGSGEGGYLIEWSADCNSDGIVDYGQILEGVLEDANLNGVPDCCDAGVSCESCPSDIDQNGRTDGIDLAIILGRWGTNPKDYPRADTNDDDTVDANDLAVVLSGWGKCP